MFDDSSAEGERLGNDDAERNHSTKQDERDLEAATTGVAEQPKRPSHVAYEPDSIPTMRCPLTPLSRLNYHTNREQA